MDLKNMCSEIRRWIELIQDCVLLRALLFAVPNLWDMYATVVSVGFVVDKVALGQVFSEYFGFPCQSSFHQLLHNHPYLSFGAVQ
jgi:hypothetical protein